MLISMREIRETWGVHPTGVLHIGGHTGEEADQYDAEGVKRVVWLEPHPDALPSLLRNVATRPGHLVLPFAAYDRDNVSVTLHKASNICSSSILPMYLHRQKHPDVTECGQILVTGMKVDTLLARNGLRPEDFEMANLDIQGAELVALRGMEDWLRHGRWIYAEANTEELYRGCALLPDLEAFLKARGFRLAEYRAFSPTHGWGDALFVREL
jgi:FkbM family methyltransferase